jgi:hypothetical protein
VSGAVAIPLVTPELDRIQSTTDKFEYVLPQGGAFVLDLVTSLNITIAGLHINGSKDTITTTSGEHKPGDATELGFSAGVFLAPQFGIAWYDHKVEKRVMLSLGIVGGYLNTETLGNAFLLGFQPAIAAQF